MKKKEGGGGGGGQGQGKNERRDGERGRTSAHLFILFFPGVNGRRDEAQLSHTRARAHTHTLGAGNSVGNNRERRSLIQTNGGR